MGGRRTRPPRTGSGTCDRHGGGTTGPVRLAPGEAILLHTQTWSHRALRLYRSLGFRFCRTQTIVMRSKEGTGMKRYPNEFEEAMEVLRRTAFR